MIQNVRLCPVSNSGSRTEKRLLGKIIMRKLAIAIALVFCTSCQISRNPSESEMGQRTSSENDIRRGYLHESNMPATITVIFRPSSYPLHQDDFDPSEYEIIYQNTLYQGSYYPTVLSLAGISSDQYESDRSEFHADHELIGSWEVIRRNPKDGLSERISGGTHSLKLSDFTFIDGDTVYASRVAPY
jgi:hypothetical protein